MKNRNGLKSGIRFLCVMAAGLILLTACGKAEQKRAEGEDGSSGADTDKFDLEYPFVAESESGYYFWEQMNADQYYPRLMFMDKETARVVPLCNKPDCVHEGKECNAYFPEEEPGVDGIEKLYLQYYKGNLYAVGPASDGYAVLYRIEEDGSEWEIAAKLYRTDYAAEGHWRTPIVFIMDEYVYFIDRKQIMMKLERIPLGGGAAEVIFEGDSSAEEIQIYRMKCNDEDKSVYFQVLTFAAEGFENATGGLYRFDTVTGQCSPIKSDLIGPYSVQSGLVYYGSTQGLCRYSMQDKTTDVLNDRPMDVPNITLTEDHIILCDHMKDSTLVIYDYEGNQIATVRFPFEMRRYYGGDSDALFGEYSDETGRRLCFLDLTRPIEELQWEELREN